jgi:hypothetical protein
MSHRSHKDDLSKILHTERQIEHETEGDLNADLTLIGVAKEIRTTLREILAELRTPQRLTTSAIIQFSGGITVANNALTLNVGQTSTATIVPVLADGVTPSGATLSAVSFAFSDPSATVVLNSDGQTATVTGVADSAGAAVSGQALFTATDTDGAVAQFSQGFTITTVGTIAPPPPSQLTQSGIVTFSTPQ